MRTFLTTVILLVATLAMAQPPKFTEVVEVPNVSADALYGQAKAWFAESFKSAQDVIQLDDASNNKIIGKGSTGEYFIYSSFGVDVFGIAEFTVKIECKEGRYRYNIYSITEKMKIAGSYIDSSTSIKELYEMSTPELFNQARVKNGLKPLKGKKLEKQSKPTSARYKIIVVQIQEIEKSLKNYMAKAGSQTEDDW